MARIADAIAGLIDRMSPGWAVLVVLVLGLMVVGACERVAELRYLRKCSTVHAPVDCRVAIEQGTRLEAAVEKP